MLYIGPDVESSKRALCTLGGREGKRRRFQSYTSFPASSDEFRGWQEKRAPGLIKMQEPKGDSYDLVLVEADTDQSIDVLSPTGMETFLRSCHARPQRERSAQVGRGRHGRRIQNNRVSELILHVLDWKVIKDKLAEHNETFLIPRIEADDMLNAKIDGGVNSGARSDKLGQDKPLALKICEVGLLETLIFGQDEKLIHSEAAEDELELEVKASSVTSLQPWESSSTTGSEMNALALSYGRVAKSMTLTSELEIE
ncbi:MAG: hypothetical protein Q9196_006326 [Gyalolechia fulgens]